MTEQLSRRAVLAGACANGAAAVAGCATYTSGRAAPSTAAPSGAGSGPGFGASVTAAPGAPGGASLAATTDIPVGGGKVFPDQDVVVGQPTAGRFVAFSATCTHQGCTVSTITGRTVNCPCHGSKFSLADGSVVAGPAKTALGKKEITVAGGQITLA
jgi:Rieske Fe-S protein